MKHKNAIFVLRLALLLASLLVLTACTSHSTTRSVSNTTRTLENASGTETFTLDVGSVANSVDIRIHCNLTSGSMRWTLTDPQNNVQWEGTATHKEDVSRQFQTIAGEWVLDITTESADGKYSVEWEAIGTQLGSKQ
ncbi:MAG: hypothetical protein JXA21_10220 [Anaerolineae bacterium]|nr:hypothetical protein [Anaerolineae bacterium]